MIMKKNSIKKISVDDLIKNIVHYSVMAKFNEFKTDNKVVPNLKKIMRGKDLVLRNVNINENGLVKEVRKGDESEYKEISNFVPYITNEIVEHSIDCSEKRLLSVGVYFHGTIYKPKTRPSAEYLQKNWLLSSAPFACRIYDSYDSVYHFLQDLSKKVATVHQYSYIGWANDLEWTYVHYGGAISKEEYTDITLTKELEKFELEQIKSSRKKNLMFIKKRMFGIMNNSYIKIMISFLLLSLTSSRFTDVEPEFIMLIYGLSGSYKTSITKLIFNIFKGYYNNAPMNVAITTPAAMEQNGTVFKDCVCLYDDIPQTNNPTVRTEYRDKVDRLARSTGDGTGRQKMNGNKKKTIKAGGLSAVTAEYVPMDNPSSVARSVILYFNEDNVNFNVYLDVKEQKSKYITFVTQYIEYIAACGDNYMSKLNEYYIEAYDTFEKLSIIHNRTPNIAAWLYASYKMFLGYANDISYKIFDSHELNHFKKDLVKLMEDQEQYMTEQNCINIFVSSLKEMLATGIVSLSEIITKENRKKTAHIKSNHIGYTEDKYIYLLPKSTLGAINSFLKRNNNVLPVTEGTLNKYLENSNMLIVNETKNGCKTVKISVNGQRHNVLKFESTLFYDDKA